MTTNASTGRHPDRASSGEAVLITGAASGIGRAMAWESAAAGLDVVLVDRDAAGISETAWIIQEERKAGAVLAEIAIDLSRPGAPATIVERLKAESAPVTRLFHAAGIIIRRDSVEAVTDEDWDHQVAINQKASWFLTRAFCQYLIDESRSGAVALVSSISGSLGLMSGSWVYATTKAGVNAMVKGFAKTYGPSGIRLNAIAPGLVETPMVRGDVDNAEVTHMLDNNVPLRRMAQPAEIAKAGLFLLSDNASYITGITLDVDGGWLRR